MASNYGSGCRVPLEILRSVVEHIQPQSNLLPVALSCTALREEAQRFLFMAPTLPTPLSNLKFLKIVVTSPSRLALFVKTYTQFCMLPPGATPKMRQTLRKRTVAALQVMINLKKLGYRATGSEPAANILRGCTFQLSALVWACYADDAQVLLREILPYQNGLGHLSLLRPGALSSGDIEAAKSLCPKLTSLGGPASLLPAFLPGRNIRHLQWTLEREANSADVDTALFPAELQAVESLIYDANEDFPLQSIASHLRSVKFMMLSRHTAEFENFPELPNLSILLISDNAASAVPPAWHLDSVVTAFRHYKALKYLDWQVGRQSYVRYTLINLNTCEFDATLVEENEALPWKDQEYFGITLIWVY